MFYTTQSEAQNAAQEESQAMLANDTYIEFNGSTCDECENEDPCKGWDGNDRRCSCGNNRVYWEFDKMSDDQWYYYAEVC